MLCPNCKEAKLDILCAAQELGEYTEDANWEKMDRRMFLNFWCPGCDASFTLRLEQNDSEHVIETTHEPFGGRDIVWPYRKDREKDDD